MTVVTKILTAKNYEYFLEQLAVGEVGFCLWDNMLSGQMGFRSNVVWEQWAVPRLCQIIHTLPLFQLGQSEQMSGCQIICSQTHLSDGLMAFLNE